MSTRAERKARANRRLDDLQAISDGMAPSDGDVSMSESSRHADGEDADGDATLATALCEAYALNQQRPDWTKRRMPTLDRPASPVVAPSATDDGTGEVTP